MAILKSEAKLTEPFVGKKEVIVMLSVQDGQSTASATKLDYDAIHALEQMIIDLTFTADTPQTERSIEADKVVEALKICDHNSDGESCKTCTYRDAKWDGAWESEDGKWCCYNQLASDAISLIEQTERSSE